MKVEVTKLDDEVEAEVRIVLTKKEAQQLSHAIACDDDCIFPEIREVGKKLAYQLNDRLWRIW